MAKLGAVPVIGTCLFATQTTVRGAMSLYQMPKNLAVEVGGVKNPSSKTPPAETSVCPSAMEELAVILSTAEAGEKRRSTGRRANVSTLVAMAVVVGAHLKALTRHHSESHAN